MKKVLAILVCMLAFASFGVDEVLYWMVDDAAQVHYHDGSLAPILELVPDAIDTTLAARVRVVGGNLLDDTFTDIYIGDGERWPGDGGIDFDNVGGYWGVGNPTGIQAPITSFSSVEYSFMIELGNYDWNNDSWTTVASSRPANYSSLSQYIYTTFDINPPTTGIWNPRDFYVPIPEPNSGLLILVGFGILCLKRKSYEKRY